ALSDLEGGKEAGREGKLQAPGGYQPSGSGDGSDAGSPGEVVLQAKGYVIPVSLIQVSPKVGGQLVEIADNFKEGAVFKEGDVLARREKVDYEAEYEQARAASRAAEGR